MRMKKHLEGIKEKEMAEKNDGVEGNNEELHWQRA